MTVAPAMTMLPAELAERLRGLMAAGFSGDVTLHWYQGKVISAKFTEELRLSKGSPAP